MEVEILCQCGSNLGGEKLWENYGGDEDVGGLVGVVEQLLTVPAIFCKTSKYRKNCECCPVSQLSVRYQRLSCIQAPNCQNCNQCLKCHKSAGLSFQNCLNCLSCLSCPKLSKLSKIAKIVKYCQKLSSRIVIKNCHKNFSSDIIIKNCH